jgi:hypothetical protein
LIPAAAFAVALVSAGPAFVAPAGAAQNGGSASIANGTLTVSGTNGADVVMLGADATEALVTFGDDPANVHHFNLADFSAISVSLGNGDDQFTEQPGVLTDKKSTVDGGNGNDTIKTGDGVDTIFGGNGDDTVDAGRGNDSVFLGNGKDFFVWNPGEGSDAVDGGNGNEDIMQFNGGISMDMNDIEIFNLKALGGVDNVTVNNLEGTSVRQANIDLSGSAGGGDQAADVVTVNGTDQDDHVNVTAPGGQIGVAGLHTARQIAGSEALLDHLQVNTRDGDDTVTVDPNVSTFIGVAVDLGLGQH